MLLHVERTRVQAEGPAHEPELSVGQGRRHELASGKGRDLHEDGGDGEGLGPVYEEGVEEYEDCAGGQAQEPRPEGHDGEGRVVGFRYH